MTHKSPHSPSSRSSKVHVKTAAKRSASSTRWLQRQLNDPYVAEAKRLGYRSRAAFKLLQINDKFKILSPGKIVVDLGAAPGGWTQVAASLTKSKGKVIGIDILDMPPVPGAEFLHMDFMDDSAPARLIEMLEGRRADVVLSDLAPSTTGNATTDHLRIMNLVELAYDFAQQVLAPGGAFVAKLFQGGTEKNLLEQMKKDFHTVRHFKPEASRKDSSEIYVVCTGFRSLKPEVR